MCRILLLFLYFTAFVAQAQPADTLSLWNYQLEPRAKTQKDKSVALITFWRTKPINDSIHLARHQELWTPTISFSVFPLADSAYCRAQSTKIKMSSSCLGPDIGGDMHRVGNFILLNRDICLSCVAYVSEKDYCRPVVTKIFGAIDNKKVKTLQDLEAQMGVKKGDRYK